MVDEVRDLRRGAHSYKVLQATVGTFKAPLRERAMETDPPLLTVSKILIK